MPQKAKTFVFWKKFQQKGPPEGQGACGVKKKFQKRFFFLLLRYSCINPLFIAFFFAFLAYCVAALKGSFTATQHASSPNNSWDPLVVIWRCDNDEDHLQSWLRLCRNFFVYWVYSDKPGSLYYALKWFYSQFYIIYSCSKYIQFICFNSVKM